MSAAGARSASLARRAATATTQPTQQSLKSAQTRAKLIDAAIRRIVRYGYSSTTTPQVAFEAGLSRGAMLHHFESGAALIKAAFVALHEKRLRALARMADVDHNDAATLIAIYWKQVSKPAFIAFHELALASRTNPDLAKILKPLQAEFRERFDKQAISLFPEWSDQPDRFRVAMALSQTTLEGMAINLLTGAIGEDMVDPMLAYLEGEIRKLNPLMNDQTR